MGEKHQGGCFCGKLRYETVAITEPLFATVVIANGMPKGMDNTVIWHSWL